MKLSSLRVCSYGGKMAIGGLPADIERLRNLIELHAKKNKRIQIFQTHQDFVFIQNVSAEEIIDAMRRIYRFDAPTGLTKREWKQWLNQCAIAAEKDFYAIERFSFVSSYNSESPSNKAYAICQED